MTRLPVWLYLLLFSAVAIPARGEVSFTPLGYLTDGDFYSTAVAVSADGKTVVGYSKGLKKNAFMWSAEGGMKGFGFLPAEFIFCDAFCVSADGSIVGGRTSNGERYEAVLYTDRYESKTLSDRPATFNLNCATGVSADGSTIVGGGHDGSRAEAFRWTNGRLVGLGDLAGGTFKSEATGVSASGAVVVGISHGRFGYEAFRWNEEDRMVGLGDLSGDLFHSEACAVSADGSTVVGFGTGVRGKEAFSWTEKRGMVGLGDLPGGLYESVAYGVSGDGSTVVGISDGALGAEAFIWDSTNGMRSILELLTSAGVDLSGWRLYAARDVSDDGRVVIGFGKNPRGRHEAWIVNMQSASSDIGSGLADHGTDSQ